MAQRKEHFHGKCVLGMSITQIIFGVACIILQIVLITFTSHGILGQGFWAGTFFLITGILGIVASQRKDSCTIIAFLVMAILSAVIALLGLLSISASGWALYWNVFYSLYYSSRQNSALDNYLYTTVQSSLAIYVIMTIIAITEAILAIVSSGYACHGLCCGDSNKQGHVVGQVQYVPGPNGQQQAVVIPMNQQGEYTSLQGYPQPYAPGRTDQPPKY